MATVFEDVRVFDGSAEELSAAADVLIDEGRIAAIAPRGQLADPRALKAARVSGRGRTLLPGLIDCHDITVTERVVGVWQDGRELERSKR